MDGAAPSTPPQAFALHPGTPRRQDGLQAIPAPGHAAGGGGLIDTRAIGKLRTFSGKEEDWPPWAFVARGSAFVLRRLQGIRHKAWATWAHFRSC